MPLLLEKVAEFLNEKPWMGDAGAHSGGSVGGAFVPHGSTAGHLPGMSATGSDMMVVSTHRSFLLVEHPPLLDTDKVIAARGHVRHPASPKSPLQWLLHVITCTTKLQDHDSNSVTDDSAAHDTRMSSASVVGTSFTMLARQNSDNSQDAGPHPSYDGLPAAAALARLLRGLTIQQVLLERLDHLKPGLQLTLKVASVMGQQVELDFLAAVHPLQVGGCDLRQN